LIHGCGSFDANTHWMEVTFNKLTSAWKVINGRLTSSYKLAIDFQVLPLSHWIKFSFGYFPSTMLKRKKLKCF
jgi:hypothetical protein